MARLIERTFSTRASAAATWAHLSDVTAWPSWARHIERVTLDPPGELAAGSRGRIVLRPGVPTSFAVTAFEPGHSWSWRGSFLGTKLDYDHVIAARRQVVGAGAPGGAIVTFAIDGSGPTAVVVGPVFAALYGRILDRAIHNLVLELDALDTQAEQPPNDPEPS
jgi:hypothetical protein